jgi:hypothetical protein
LCHAPDARLSTGGASALPRIHGRELATNYGILRRGPQRLPPVRRRWPRRAPRQCTLTRLLFGRNVSEFCGSAFAIPYFMTFVILVSFLVLQLFVVGPAACAPPPRGLSWALFWRAVGGDCGQL